MALKNITRKHMEITVPGRYLTAETFASFRIFLIRRFSWKDITVHDFAIAFNINAAPLMHDEELILEIGDIKNPLFLSSKFWASCEKLMEHRLSIRKNLFVGIKQVSTWNVGGAAIHRLNMNKLRTFKRLGAQSILCLQETRWSQSGDTSLQQRLNRMQVVHTPAANTHAGGLSGGAAMLIPLGFNLLKHVVIQVSRIHAVLLQFPYSDVLDHQLLLSSSRKERLSYCAQCLDNK